MTSTRGLVISTPTLAIAGELSIDSNFDEQALRFWLLFWDKLYYPQITFPIFETSLGPDADWLEKIGLLTKVQVSDVVISMTFPTGNDKPEEQYQYHFLKAYNELDQSEPGVWSLATGRDSIVLDEHEFDSARGILVRLHRALPVPHRDVPFEDLLDFKRKRHPELQALRCHLEKTYQAIRAAPDSPLAIYSELNALDLTLCDYQKAAKSSLIQRWVPTDIELSLEISKGVNVGVGTFALGLPAVSAALAGVTAAIKISSGAALKRRNRDSNVPWRYVTHYLDEL